MTTKIPRSRPAPTPTMPVGSPSSAQKPLQLPWVLFWILIHIPLALLFNAVGELATVHALVVVGLGFYWAVFEKRIERIAYLVAYIAGSEVLWRMAKASIFWETGKYAVIGILLVTMLRRKCFDGPVLPLLYILLLLPSTVLTFFAMNLPEARSQLSFNLSGPLAAFICAWFFSKVKLQRAQLMSLLLTLIAPIVSAAAIAAYGIISNSKLVFVDDSNLATSGGFGPNQVSATLGFGALAALFCILDKNTGAAIKLFLFGVMVALLSQSAMTFSRGGLYNAAGAALVALFFTLRNPRTRGPILAATLAIFLVVNFAVLPRLDSFTGGALMKRFQDTALTNRDKIAREDLILFAQNPIFGVGVGVGRLARERGRDQTAAHTEFTRLLAEHGLFGATAAFFLLSALVGRLQRTPLHSKAFIAAMFAWSFLFMLNAGMRLVAPSLAIGLCFLSWMPTFAPAASAQSMGNSRSRTGGGRMRRRPQNLRRRAPRLAASTTES